MRTRTRTRTRVAALVAASALIATLAGCSSSSPATPSASETTADDLSGTVTIYAAASLKKAFDELATEFTAAHPGVTVAPIVYDGSSTLATQIIGGASVDVFASADTKNMTKVTDASLASDPVNFATNTLVVATPKDNPGGVTTLADLAKSILKVVLCAAEVPCGAASATLLKNQNVTVTPVSSEQNVTAVLTKVRSGEADAGLVYATDVKGLTDVNSFVPDGASKVVNTYPIVALKDAPNPSVAAAFAAFVAGPEGQKVLSGLGFGAP